MKKRLILSISIALTLVALALSIFNLALPPTPIHAQETTGVKANYVNVYNLRDDIKHIELVIEAVLVDGDRSFSTPWDQIVSYTFPSDGEIKNAMVTWGGGHFDARPDYFAAMCVAYNGCVAQKFTLSHSSIGDNYNDWKDEYIWLSDWNFPVQAGSVVHLELEIEKHASAIGKVWFGGTARMLFEPKVTQVKVQVK